MPARRDLKCRSPETREEKDPILARVRGVGHRAYRGDAAADPAVRLVRTGVMKIAAWIFQAAIYFCIWDRAGQGKNIDGLPFGTIPAGGCRMLPRVF